MIIFIIPIKMLKVNKRSLCTPDRLLEFLDNRHMKVVRLSGLRTSPPRSYRWYSFLLEAESSTAAHSGRKD